MRSDASSLSCLPCVERDRALCVSTGFGDDALGYFTERLDPAVTDGALLETVRRAKRNKAFDNCRFIGLAIDGTTAERSSSPECALCRPPRNANQEVTGYRHHFAAISVVGAGLLLPFDVEPYGPDDSEYAAHRRNLTLGTAAPGAVPRTGGLLRVHVASRRRGNRRRRPASRPAAFREPALGPDCGHATAACRIGLPRLQCSGESCGGVLDLVAWLDCLSSSGVLRSLPALRAGREKPMGHFRARVAAIVCRDEGETKGACLHKPTLGKEARTPIRAGTMRVVFALVP